MCLIVPSGSMILNSFAKLLFSRTPCSMFSFTLSSTTLADLERDGIPKSVFL